MRIDPFSWPTLSRLLDQWLDLPEESRANWLESLDAEHANVLPMLRQLIANQSEVEAGNFLGTLPILTESVNPGGDDAAPLLHTLNSGMLVGPYRLARELGQGGMGVVWLAERADGEMKRPVALKLPMVSLPGGMLAERFARERDILARLTHPHIARLYDAGVSNLGQPYLALEYVEGEKITIYCDQRKLGVRPRLTLFLQVLGAVQYAHTNLVVHRDLKPANILVTGEGDVRLLDFGIAKLLTEGNASQTELTRVGGQALTPDYASPEQISGDPVSTASDVYSLGVVLYELLTGARPYKLKRETRGRLEEAILAADPSRPSQVNLDAAAAEARGVTAARLARSLKGDLDSIVLKALGKQPSQRYATADAFAQDIGRYLTGEAVVAQPESVWYRLRKFVGRNKLPVVAAAAVVAALSIGLGAALREARIAQVQTRTADTVRTFLLDLFRANSNQHADPVRARQTTARELLDIGAKQIDGALLDAPEAKLGVLETLFHLYIDLGLQEQAASLAHQRIALARSVYGAHHPEVARALIDLAANTVASSSANDRRVLLMEANSILDRNRDSQSQVRALYYLAMGGVVFGEDLTSAADFAAKSVQLYRKYPPTRDTVSALNLLGQTQDHLGKYSEATASLSEAARVANSLQGEARGPLPAIYAYLGDSQRHTMDMSGAEQSLRLAVETAHALKGDDHPDVLQTEYRLGVFLAQTSRPQEGLDWLKKAVDLAVRTQGPEDTFHTPMALEGYGLYLVRYGRAEEGQALYDRCIGILRHANLSGTDNFANSLALSAGGEVDLGHLRKAEAMLAEVEAIYARTGPPGAGHRNEAAMARARLLIATGRENEAAAILDSVPVEDPGAGKISYVWLDQLVARAETALARKQANTTLDYTKEIRRRIGESGVAVYLKRWDTQASLLEGKALLLSGRGTDALAPLERALQLGNEVFDPARSLLLADSEIALASSLAELGRSDRARALLAQAKAIHATHRELGEQYKAPLRLLETRLRGR